MTFISTQKLASARRDPHEAPEPAPSGPAGGSSMDLRIVGMHCASCVSRVEQALGTLPGVSRASVNLATERAHVDLEAALPFERLAAAVRAAGYDARPVSLGVADDAEARERAAELAAVARRLRVSIALGAPVVVLGMFGMFPPLDRIPMSVQNAIQLVLALPVQLWAGAPFLRAIPRAIRRGIADMDLLIGVGTLTAFLASSVATLFPGTLRGIGVEPHVYFDTAVTIVTLILLGRLLEARAKAGTSSAMRRLLDLQPRTANRVEDGATQAVPLDSVRPGDPLLVRPGERVPVDGVVLDGGSSIDRSMLTGESMPVEVGPGGAVTGGTVNRVGAFRMRAERVGAESTLMQMVRLVQEAQASKASVARLADRIASVFVPIVLGIALVAMLAWLVFGPEPRLAHALLSGVAVLIIACPCALGLATPTALIVGTGRGAELGILMRGAAALERAEAIDVVVFDKTGTLTRGRPELTDVVPATGVDAERVLAAAASAEARSEHPLAIAIGAAARDRGIPVAEPEDFAAVPGQGVIAVRDGAVLVLGTEALLREQGVDPAPLAAERERLERAGRTVAGVAERGVLLGLVAVADTLKPDARDAVGTLRRLGHDVWMITGDNRGTALAVAAETGIAPDRVLAGVMPADKAERVRALQAGGRRVAMVGDGINDAPALAAADLGIAMGSGTDVAMEASDLTLVRTDLASVPTAIRLARRTLQVIRQNLFWAFAYNTLGIPIAAGLLYVVLREGGPMGPLFGWQGTLHPMVASIAMAFSSVSVVTSSLRLRNFR